MGAERAEWHAKVRSVGLSLSDLVRRFGWPGADLDGRAHRSWSESARGKLARIGSKPEPDRPLATEETDLYRIVPGLNPHSSPLSTNL